MYSQMVFLGNMVSKNTKERAELARKMKETVRVKIKSHIHGKSFCALSYATNYTHIHICNIE